MKTGEWMEWMSLHRLMNTLSFTHQQLTQTKSMRNKTCVSLFAIEFLPLWGPAFQIEFISLTKQTATESTTWTQDVIPMHARGPSTVTTVSSSLVTGNFTLSLRGAVVQPSLKEQKKSNLVHIDSVNCKPISKVLFKRSFRWIPVRLLFDAQHRGRSP